MPTLYLLSGLLSDDTAWRDVAGLLEPDADVHIVSFAGYDSLTAMARHVLDLAPARFVLVGHSMGGRVAIEAWRLAPQRIQALGLFNTGVHPTADSEPASRGRLLKLAREQGMAAVAAEWLPPMMGASTGRVRELMPQLNAMVERYTPDQFAAQIKAMLERPEARAVLPTITVPVVLASGERDSWSPLPQHEEMRREIAGAELHPIADAGHMAPVERPQAVAEIIRKLLLRL